MYEYEPAYPTYQRTYHLWKDVLSDEKKQIW